VWVVRPELADIANRTVNHRIVTLLASNIERVIVALIFSGRWLEFVFVASCIVPVLRVFFFFRSRDTARKLAGSADNCDASYDKH
jgi:hypothetical protein